MGFGTTELIVIAFIGLLIFGPSRLSKLGKSMGEGIGSFRAGIKEAEESTEIKPVIIAEDEKKEK